MSFKAVKDMKDGCWNCLSYDWKHEACITNWNNSDESYYRHGIDDKPYDYFCEYWEEDPDAEPMEEQLGGGLTT